jgi:hypothetical protein
MKRSFSTMALAATLAGLAGCGSAGIAYQPSAAPASFSRRVVLKVLDNRAPREGGSEPAVVGFRRSAVGIKASIKESGPEAVANLVRAATEDALGRAGIGASPEASLTLQAQVLTFWMDWAGYDFLSGVAYKGTIAVEYTLQDAAGRTLWKGLALVERHHRNDSKEAIFGPALKRLSGRTERMFRTAEFQKALR